MCERPSCAPAHDAYDYLVVGAGIAGATAAYGLSRHGRVLLVEMEDRPGYHTTGRSAAFYSETYGNAAIRVLTTGLARLLRQSASRICHRPAPGRARRASYRPGDQREAVDAKARDVESIVDSVQRLDARQVADIVPVLRDGYADCGLFEPEAKDIDVGAVHAGFLKHSRYRGMELVTNAEVVGLRRDKGLWTVETMNGLLRGAYRDQRGRRLGRPGRLARRRQAGRPRAAAPDDHYRAERLSAGPDGMAAGDRYRRAILFQAGIRPHPDLALRRDADAALDVRPDELDIARAIDRVQRATEIQIDSIINKWAGLRTFAPDRTPVVGYDDKVENFFWYVGQGGWGIQTSAGMSRLCEALVPRQASPKTSPSSGLARGNGLAEAISVGPAPSGLIVEAAER